MKSENRWLEASKRLSDQKEAPFKRNGPIDKLPLMENPVQIGKNKNAIVVSLDPVSRPTRSICVLGAQSKTLDTDSIIICIRCTSASRCTNCVCSLKRYSDDGSGFINAQKIAGPERNKLSSIVKETEVSYSICTECNSDEIGSVFVSVNPGLHINYKSISTSLDFYHSHKTVLVLLWSSDAALNGTASLQRQEKYHIPAELNDRFYSEASRSDYANTNLRILSRAFSSKAVPAIKYTALEHNEIPREFPEKNYLHQPEQEKIKDFVYLASGRYTNILLQEEIKDMSQEDLLKTLLYITPASFFQLSKHKYGTYVIQLIISMVKDEALVTELKKLILPYSSSLLQHEIGNYVVQGMLSLDPYFVLECFLKNFLKIVSNKIGSRAFKNCIKSFGVYKREILPILIASISSPVVSLDEQKVLKFALRELQGISSYK
ncbi:hypothetical protein NEOKW01_1629 [Nematocida sp. AWRm80]|nr:hypothetical protein NEOKW01_1629 [Nematocida sp. AWRm80]